ncbi:MAG: hypothetical protein E7140_01610 [Rikenellaceae bacterium]|nr:hypothetical protein [Rikenellaceae bacterium]
MKMKKIFLLLAVMFVASAVEAQELSQPRKVENLTINDINGNPTTLPQFGEKNLLIFYVDPDSYLKGGANKKLSDALEENGRAAGPAIRGFGVMNFPDTGLPKNMVRNMARKRAAKNGATILDDDQQLLKKAWGLGDCNNKFVIMIVTKEGELVYCAKDDLDDAGVENFYKVVDKYRN